MNLSVHNLRATLVRAMGLYPFGIPTRYFKPLSNQSNNNFHFYGPESASLLVVASFESVKDYNESANLVLLKGIVENGLKLNFNQVRILVLGSEIPQNEATKLVSDNGQIAKQVILFGSFGAWSERLAGLLGAQNVLELASLDQIRLNVGIKRAAWEKLKSFNLINANQNVKIK